MPRSLRTRSWMRHAVVTVAAALVAGPVAAQGTGEFVLHEYFKSDPAEDLALAATTPDGRFPAAIQTPSGVVPAPDPGRSPLARDHVYGGAATTAGRDAEYRIDRNTTRPSSVEYDDPFNPSVTPFKRSFAYDAVDDRLELRVADQRLRPVPVGGAPRDDDDQFYGDLVVDLVEGEAVRVPTVGPGTRALAVQTFPETTLELLRDGADNWFVRAAVRRRVRLTLELAIPRAVFGSPFAEVSFAELPRPSPLPAAAEAATSRVLERLGVSRALRPREALAELVAHFRAFAPSTELPQADDPVGLYEELALSRKGVCRHRAYAFVVTALALGLPARLVRNEAHAWVEVNDGTTWHRIDLGGAAGHLELDPTASGFQHVPPRDPRPWPLGAESGTALAERAREELGSRAPGGPSGAEPTPRADPGRALGVPAPGLDSSGRAPATMRLELDDRTVRRGEPLRLRGALEQDGRACGGARIDVGLERDGADPVPLGSLATRRDGTFAGAVTVRLDLEVGDYDVVVTSPTTAHCGPGVAR